MASVVCTETAAIAAATRILNKECMVGIRPGGRMGGKESGDPGESNTLVDDRQKRQNVGILNKYADFAIPVLRGRSQR